jgi:uncharacterized protein with FMN-binding domain
MPRALSVAALALVLFAGCGPSQSTIERSIRDEMKKSMNVEIGAINITKQADGGYTGTASATNGDVYDVLVNPAQGNRTEWKAYPGQAMLEKLFRTEIAKSSGAQPTALTLTKGGSVGVYTGTATMPNGQRLSLRTFLQGNQVMIEALPAK